MNKTWFIIAICLLFSTTILAQNTLQGRVLYTISATPVSDKKIDSISKKHKAKSKKMQQWMKKLLKGGKDVTGILKFANGVSLYVLEDEMQTDNGRVLNMTRLLAGDRKYYRNNNTKEYFDQFEIDEPLIVEVNPNKWKITQESKKIGNYICYKAIKINTDSRSKSVDIAWFTPQIPVNFGPSSYFGLPGLILEVNRGKITMKATKIELNPKKKIKIKKPTEGKRMTSKEYREMTRNFFKNVERESKRKN